MATKSMRAYVQELIRRRGGRDPAGRPQARAGTEPAGDAEARPDGPSSGREAADRRHAA